MDRNSKVKSVRLSGIFDLFSEEKGGKYCEKTPDENLKENPQQDLKEKRTSLFSFKKKHEIDSKLCEKRKDKTLFRYISSDPSSLELRGSNKGEECIDYEEVVLRKPRLAGDLTPHRKTLPIQLEHSGRGSLEFSFNREQFSSSLPGNPQLSSGEISPTSCKSNKKPKFFRFSSKQKEKPISNSFNVENDDEKMVKQLCKGKGEMLQSTNKCEDVLIISHGDSIMRLRTEGRCEEMDSAQKAKTVTRDVSSDIFIVRGNEKFCESKSANQLTQSCNHSMHAGHDGNTTVNVQAESLLKKCIGLPVSIFNGLCMFIKTYLILIIRFLLALPQNILLIPKFIFCSFCGGCRKLLMSIKYGFVKENQIEAKTMIESSEQDGADSATNTSESTHPRMAFISPETDSNISKNELDIGPKECKPKWRKIFHQLSKDGRHKGNKENANLDLFKFEDDTKCMTEPQTKQNDNHFMLKGNEVQTGTITITKEEESQEECSRGSLILFIKKFFRFLAYIILFIPLNAIFVMKCLFSKIAAFIFRISVALRRICIRNTVQPSVSNDSMESSNKKIGIKRFLNVFRQTKKQEIGPEKENIDRSERETSFSSDIDSSPKSLFMSKFDPRASSRKLASYLVALYDLVCLCFITLVNLVIKVIFCALKCMKLLLLYLSWIISLPFVLLGKFFILIFVCIKWLILCLRKVFLFIIKAFCMAVLLVLSFPIGVIVVLQIVLCFLGNVCSDLFAMVVKMLSPDDVTGHEKDLKEKSIGENELLSEICEMVPGKKEGKIERIIKKLKVNRLFKKKKKSTETDSSSDEESSLNSSDDINHGLSLLSKIIMTSTEAESKSSRIWKIYDFIMLPLSKTLSIILSVPFSIVLVPRMALRFAVSSFREMISISNSDEELSAESSASSVSSTSDESSNANVLLDLQMVNMKLNKLESKRVKVPLKDESLLESDQSTIASKPYQSRIITFFRIFLHLQSIFVAALWHRVDALISSIAKVLLLGMLYLTPSGVIKWITIVTIRFTPGVRNRKILLSFLEETPAKITKRAMETYVRNVPISVMMVQVQMTLKESSSKTFLKYTAKTLKSVTKVVKSFFLNVSSFFRNLSKKIKIRKNKVKSSLKERVLQRLKSEDGDGKKCHMN